MKAVWDTSGLTAPLPPWQEGKPMTPEESSAAKAKWKAPVRSELDALIRESVAAYNAMTPEAKREMHRQQRISWVYGNLALSNPSITREMVEKAAEDW